MKHTARNDVHVTHIEHMLGRVFDAIDNGGCVSNLIADDERKAGRCVVRPGESFWLPLADWNDGTVCSYRSSRVRLILLHARAPGTGAFTRLIDALRHENLIPFVIAPTREFASALKRNGWHKTRLNGEEAWRR
jgi:hypothetical protein